MVGGLEPREAIRGIALGMFDAIDAHPWVGAQFSREPFSREPWRPAMLRIIEGIGGRLQALGVPERARCDAGPSMSATPRAWRAAEQVATSAAPRPCAGTARSS